MNLSLNLKKILKTRIEENQAIIEKTNRDLEEWQEKYYEQLHRGTNKVHDRSVQQKS
jgi:hypothetical protein